MIVRLEFIRIIGLCVGGVGGAFKDADSQAPVPDIKIEQIWAWGWSSVVEFFLSIRYTLGSILSSQG
jgi:hypothetical protein